MSFHVATIKGGHEVWELLNEDGELALLTATFREPEDAQFFADLKNGLRQSAAGEVVDLGSFAEYADAENFVYTDCKWEDEVPEASPDDVVLMDDSYIDAEFVVYPPKEDEDWFYSILDFANMSDEQQIEAYLNGADIDVIDHQYSTDTTPTRGPLAPEHGDFL